MRKQDGRKISQRAKGPALPAGFKRGYISDWHINWMIGSLGWSRKTASKMIGIDRKTLDTMTRSGLHRDPDNFTMFDRLREMIRLTPALKQYNASRLRPMCWS